MSTCDRTDCPHPATVSVAFDHDTETLTVAAPAGEPVAHRYNLCAEHGDVLPPTGWTVTGEATPRRRLHLVTAKESR